MRGQVFDVHSQVGEKGRLRGEQDGFTLRSWRRGRSGGVCQRERDAVAQCERSRGASRELEKRSQGEEGGFVKLRQLARVRRKRLRKV